MTTRIPMSTPNLAFLTGASLKKTRAWLDELVVSGVLDMDVDDQGETIYRVIGSERSASGPRTPDDLSRVKGLEQQARGAIAGFDPSVDLRRFSSAGKKSVLASGGLSLIFGPMGWLYAGHFKEAIPGALVYVALCSIFPVVLLTPILSVMNPLAAIAGALYAMKFNRSGKRQRILDDDTKKLGPGAR